MSKTTTIFLPKVLTIYEVAETFAEFKKVIAKAKSLKVNGREVEEIDGSGIQLLLWSRIECRRTDKKWRLSKTSDQLDRYLELAGISLLDETSKGDA